MPEYEAVLAEPTKSKFLSLSSPPFAAEYPPILNKEVMPAPVLGLLDPIWRTGSFPARSINFYRLQKVFVAFEGLIFDKDLNLYPMNVRGHSPSEIETSRSWIRERMADGLLPVHLRPAVLCKMRGTYNYGHFLIEMLPKAFLAKRHVPKENLTYVVSAENSALDGVMRSALAMIDIEEADTLRCDRQPAFFADLIVIDGLTEHGRFMSPLVLECMERLAMPVDEGRSERLYVSRQSAKLRKLLNEDDLIPILSRHGYEVIDPGVLAFTEQVAAFKAARSIIGVTGAALTNVVFARPGASVKCLTPASMPETFFWFLSTLRNHNFLDVRLTEQGGEPTGYPPSAGNIRVDPAAFQALL